VNQEADEGGEREAGRGAGEGSGGDAHRGRRRGIRAGTERRHEDAMHPADPAGDAARNKVLLHGRAGEALVPVRPLVLSAFQKFFLLLVLQLQVQLHARDIGGVYFFGRAVAVVLELKRKGKAIA